MIVICIDIFVPEHPHVHMYIDVVETSLVCIECMAQLLVIFLFHQLFHLWKLVILDIVVNGKTDDFLVKPIKVFVEELVPFLDAPGGRVNRCSVQIFACLFSRLSEVHAENLCTKADSVGI